MTYARTTLTVDEGILKEAKKLAADEKKSLKSIVENALKSYLEQKIKVRRLSLKEFPSFNLGQVNEKLIKRKSLYSDYLNRKFPQLAKSQ